MSKDKYKLFHELYKNGIRFINDENSMQHGLYHTNEKGKVDGYTIRGMKRLAENKKITVEGVALTPDEVEMLFNIIAFDRSINKEEKPCLSK